MPKELASFFARGLIGISPLDTAFVETASAFGMVSKEEPVRD